MQPRVAARRKVHLGQGCHWQPTEGVRAMLQGLLRRAAADEPGNGRGGARLAPSSQPPEPSMELTTHGRSHPDGHA